MIHVLLFLTARILPMPIVVLLVLRTWNVMDILAVIGVAYRLLVPIIAVVIIVVIGINPGARGVITAVRKVRDIAFIVAAVAVKTASIKIIVHVIADINREVIIIRTVRARRHVIRLIRIGRAGVIVGISMGMRRIILTRHGIIRTAREKQTAKAWNQNQEPFHVGITIGP